MADSTLDIELRLLSQRANQALNKFEQTATRSISNVEKIQSKFSNSLAAIPGRVLAIAGAYASFQGVSRAVSQLSEFSKAIQEVNSIADDSIRNNQNLNKELLNVAKQFGSAPVKQVKSFYQIISAGITDATKAQDVLIASNKLAIGGLAEIETSVDILTTALNVYADANLDAETAADALFTGVRLGKTRVDLLASSMGKVLPLSKQLGLSFQDVTAAVAALTTKGLATSEAVTAIQSLFAGVIRAQKDLVDQSPEVQRAFDISAIKSKDFATFISDLNNAVDGSSEKLLELVGRQEGLLAVQNLAADGAKVLSQNLVAMKDSAGAANKAFEDIEQSFGRQLDKLRENLGNLVLTITTQGEGEATEGLIGLNESLERLIDNVGKIDFTSWISELGDVAKILLVVALGFKKSTDDVLNFAKATLGSRTSFNESVKDYENGTRRIGHRMGELAGFASRLLNPIVGVVQTYRESVSAVEKEQARMGKTAKKTGKEVSLLDKAIKGLADENTALGQIALSLIDTGAAAKDVKKTVEEIAEVSLEEFKKGGGLFGPILPDEGVFDKIRRNIQATFEPVGDQFASFINSITDGAERTFGLLDAGKYDEFFSGISESIETGFFKAKDFITQAGPAVAEGIQTGAKAFSAVFGGDLINALGVGLQAVFGLPEQFLKAVENLDKLFDKLIKGLEKVILKLPALLTKVINRLIGDLPKIVDLLAGALKQIATFLADSLDDIIAALLSAIAKLIGKLPEIVDKLAEALAPALRALLAGLPEVIDAVFDNLPEIVKSLADEIAPLMEVIADKIGPVVEALVEGIVGSAGEIVEALIDSLLIEGGLERIIVSIIKALPRIAAALVRGLVRGLDRAADAIGRAIARGFKEALENIVGSLGSTFGKTFSQNIRVPRPNFQIPVAKPDFKIKVKAPKSIKLRVPDAVQALADALNNFGGGGGGSAGDFIDSLTGGQHGGIVPPGFQNDTFGAALTSGELVTPPRTTKNLFNLIDGLSDVINRQKNAERAAGTGGEASQNLTVNLRVGERELADVLLNLNRQGFRVS